ncbi:Polypeptide N-acetylgalactosaminyltransferase-like 6 [Fukomys damarensis]|uniref:Polypeptide N-acetylgalactosaminyltransferase-like 6 n=1 Tax=Fukomys damarensis TaxID=885580 RepID=A0A091DK43_FUKDA|nr:Polypeptide N-acetylgalactosaminyltransferase-like 6 [Fukomys damarensis]
MRTETCLVKVRDPNDECNCTVYLRGKGEQGKPYPLTEEDNDDSAYRENGFNIFVSNNIALERSLPDIRHAK